MIFVLCFTTKIDRNNYAKNKRVVCYVGTWAVYHKIDPFEIEDIDTNRCTHVMYGFAKIDEYKYTIQVFDPFQDDNVNPWDKRKFMKFLFNNCLNSNSNLRWL